MTWAYLAVMKSHLPAGPHNHHRLVVALSAALVFVLLVGVGVYGLVAGPPDEESATPLKGTSPAFPSPVGSVIPTIPDSGDPEAFIRVAAEAIFTWDTASGLTPLDYVSAHLDTANPAGEEQPGLAADLAGYLPSHDAWLELRHYATRQSLTIDEITIPESWATAVEQARPGQLAPGTVAYTIDATRHRTGIWNDDPVATDSPVTFTVFVVCAPTYKTCRLLRLSALDNPLR